MRGSSRRNVLQLGGFGAVAALGGCTFFGGSQGYATAVVENDHDTVHLLSVTVATQPDDSGGYTEFFSEALQIQAGERETFNQGLAFTDYAPTLLAIAVIDDDTAETIGLNSVSTCRNFASKSRNVVRFR